MRLPRDVKKAGQFDGQSLATETGIEGGGEATYMIQYIFADPVAPRNYTYTYLCR